MTTEWLILTRAVHFSACLLFFGALAFDRLVAVAAIPRGPAAAAAFWAARVRWLSATALVLVLLSGLAWFALVAISMSGEALTVDILKVVWNQTQFGTLAKFRLLFWFVAAVGVALLWSSQKRPVWQPKLVWAELFFGGLLLGSLAWAGHGQDGQSPGWHLLADVLHLLVAGFWPTGLLPLALLLRKLRTAEPAPREAIAALVRRFSAIGLGSVVLLSVTGFINAWVLVGSWANLIGQPYGRWLLAKIILFCVIVAIGAVNLLRLKPGLLAKDSPAKDAAASVAKLQFNVWLELGLGMVIVVIVAILGLLPPAVAG